MAEEFTRRIPFSLQGKLELGPAQQLRIAAEACLPIVHLGLNWYEDVSELIIYPGAFFVHQHWLDDDGVEHQGHAELAGEAWDGGPVILAWTEIERGGMSGHEDYNVVIHEFAHVLDAANGVVNGFPPIRDAALASRWPSVFQSAFDAECAASVRNEPTVLDEYATENPGEFFAVASEAFFSVPNRLQQDLPELFACLEEFYLSDSV